MTTFPGVVTLADDTIDVLVGLDNETIRLTAGDVEIGIWESAACTIRPGENGTFIIEAEEDQLSFQPEDPGGFAASLFAQRAGSTTAKAQHAGSRDGTPDEDFEVRVGPPPRLPTRVAFYGLAAFTSALGIWALMSLV